VRAQQRKEAQERAEAVRLRHDQRLAREREERQLQAEKRQEEKGGPSTQHRTTAGRPPPSRGGKPRQAAAEHALPPLRNLERRGSAAAMRAPSRTSDDGVLSSAVSAMSEPITREEREEDEEYMNNLAEEIQDRDGQPPWRALLPPPVTSVFERRRVDDDQGKRRRRRATKKKEKKKDSRADQLQKMRDLYASGTQRQTIEVPPIAAQPREAFVNDETLPPVESPLRQVVIDHETSPRREPNNMLFDDVKSSTNSGKAMHGSSSLTRPTLDSEDASVESPRGWALPEIDRSKRDAATASRPSSRGKTQRDGATTFLVGTKTPRTPRTPLTPKKGPDDPGFEDAVDGLLEWATKLPDIDEQYDF